MGYRKFLSFLITVVMVVTGIFSVSLADGTEEPRTCTTESGITLFFPADFKGVLWPGIDDNDPLLKEVGIDKNTVVNMYKTEGVELQTYKDLSDPDKALFVILQKGCRSLNFHIRRSLIILNSI